MLVAVYIFFKDHEAGDFRKKNFKAKILLVHCVIYGQMIMYFFGGAVRFLLQQNIDRSEAEWRSGSVLGP